MAALRVGDANGRRSTLGRVGRSDDYGVKHASACRAVERSRGDPRWRPLIVSFDGESLFEVVDATFTEPGRVGLWTKADSVTYFDGFEIEAR